MARITRARSRSRIGQRRMHEALIRARWQQLSNQGLTDNQLKTQVHYIVLHSFTISYLHNVHHLHVNLLLLIGCTTYNIPKKEILKNELTKLSRRPRWTRCFSCETSYSVSSSYPLYSSYSVR